MSKILAQAGISLADVYDVEGSVVGVEQLLAQEVSLVHEMGGQMFSERLGAFIIEISSGAIAQSTGWAIDTVVLPDAIHRLTAVSVIAEVAADVSNASLAIQEVGGVNVGREIPIWVWNVIDDLEVGFRWSNDGAAVGNVVLLRPSQPQQIPTILPREGSGGQMPHLIFRGATGAFGAGTSTTFMLLHLMRPLPSSPTPGEPKSHGLPIPSW